MEQNIDHNFLQRITLLMKDRGLDVSKLAKAANVSYVTAQRWSNGVRPRPTKLKELADSLKISVSELTGSPQMYEGLFEKEPPSIERKMRRIKELQAIYEAGMAAKAEIEHLKLELMEDIKNIP